MLETQTLMLRNAPVRYRVRPGQPGLPPLIFLHGWRSEGAAWMSIVPYLERIAGTVYLLDLPGFGGSARNSKCASIADYCSVLEEFIRKLRLPAAIVIGHSFGGRIAIKFAATRPGLVRKLVLVSSAGFVDASFRKLAFGFIAKLIKPAFRLRFLAPLRARLYRLIGAEDYVATPELRRLFVNIVNEDLSHHLPRIAAPALLIWGSRDRETPPSFGERMRAAIPNARLVVLEGAGHFSFLDQPEEFAKALENFIQ